MNTDGNKKQVCGIIFIWAITVVIFAAIAVEYNIYFTFDKLSRDVNKALHLRTRYENPLNYSRTVKLSGLVKRVLNFYFQITTVRPIHFPEK